MERTTTRTSSKSPESSAREPISAAIERQHRRPPAWLRTIGMIWNAGLAFTFAYAAYLVVPRVLPQLLDVRWDLPASFVTRTIYVGIEGIGLLIGIGLFLFSLSTLFWRPVHRRWRWFYGFAALILMLGSAIGAAIDWWDMGVVYIEREFMFLVAVMACPIIVFGTGYLGLPCKVWHVLRKVRQPSAAT